MAKLTAKTVLTKPPGMYADGGGLYLQVATKAARSWIYRYQLDGKRRDMGLGPVETVTLAEARERAYAARKLVRDRIDPIDARRAAEAAARLQRAKAMTFQQCAEAFIADNMSGWKSAKHAKQWTATLTAYAYPAFGALPIAEIDTGLVTKVLRPIWSSKTETAARVRGRIENVLDWARTNGYRTGENPARWSGHLENLLPMRSKVQKVEHHAALAYAEIAIFMAALRKMDSTSAKALELAILTAARTCEVIGAAWNEIDFSKKVWTIPAGRMKAGYEHSIPLSDPALEILRGQHKATGGAGFVFPGGKVGKPLSNMAMLKLLQRMRPDLTVHGFRSSFRDWAADKTAFPPEVVEMALAHSSDKVVAAYRRSDLIEKRRRLADEWARYCALQSKEDGNVVSMSGKGKR